MGKRILTALFILLPITLLAQSKAQSVIQIRQIVNAVNSDSSVTKVLINAEYLAKLKKSATPYDGGEELTGYFKRDTLVKIVYSIGISTGLKTFEYYLQKDHVVFVYEQVDRYPYDEKQQQLNYNVLTNTFKGRYYLATGKVFKTIETGTIDGVKNGAIKLLKQDLPQYTAWLLKQHN